MTTIGALDEVEIVGFGRMQSGFDSFETDSAYWIGRKTFVAVGVESGFVLLDSFVRHFGVGVLGVVEGAIHLQGYPFFESVVDDRGH